MYTVYIRKTKTHIRPVTDADIADFKIWNCIFVNESDIVSIDDDLIQAEHPMIGDYIAYDDNNVSKQYLITEEQFKQEFTKPSYANKTGFILVNNERTKCIQSNNYRLTTNFNSVRVYKRFNAIVSLQECLKKDYHLNMDILAITEGVICYDKVY